MRRQGRPQPPQRRLHSAARPHRRRLHRPQHRPQPPERARTNRVRQAEPGSRVTVTVAAVGKVPVAAYCEPQTWSEQWEQPEFAWRRRLSYAWYAQPSAERRSVWFFERRIDWHQVWSEDLDTVTHRRKLPWSPTDQNYVNYQRRNKFCQILTKKTKQFVL
jgi:hypothetical protein